MQEICSLNKLVSSLDEKNAWGNDACFTESAAWDPLQRLLSLARALLSSALPPIAVLRCGDNSTTQPEEKAAIARPRTDRRPIMINLTN